MADVSTLNPLMLTYEGERILQIVRVFFGSAFGANFNKLVRVPSRVDALLDSQARTLQLQGQKVLEMLEDGREKSERGPGREECSNNFPTALHREYLLSSEFALSLCSRIMSPWSSLQHGQVQGKVQREDISFLLLH